MKKKVLGIVLATVLALSLGLVFAAPVGAHTEGDPYVTDLIAGQHTDVGEVSVWNDSTNIYVTYLITEPDWVITGTHLYVGKTDPNQGDINGNQLTTAPGQFPYSPEIAEDGLSATFTLCDVDTPFYVSAHAVIEWCERIEREGIDQ